MKAGDAIRRVLGRSARVAAIRAEIASLDSVAFMKLYFAVGKKLAAAENLPEDLEPIRRQVVALLESQAASAGAQPAAAPSGLADWFTGYARKASRAAADATNNVRLTAAYAQLGQAAVRKYGERAIPSELRDDWEKANARRASLLAEAAELESHQGYGWLTVRRVVTAGCVALPVLGGLMLVLLMGYPLLTVYALVRVAVLVGTIIAIYRAVVATIGYIKNLASAEDAGARTDRQRHLRRTAAYAAGGMLALLVLPVPKIPSNAESGRASAQAVAGGQANGRVRPQASSAVQGPNTDVTADMFLSLLFQAAAMDQLARQSSPRFGPTYAPAYPRPTIPVPAVQPGVAYGNGAGQYGGASGPGGGPRQMQQWEGVCSRCGHRTGRQVVRGNSREKCIQFSGGGQLCGGVIIWQPAQGF